MRAGQICSSAHHEKLHAAKLVAVPGGEGEAEGKGGGEEGWCWPKASLHC